MTSSNYAPLRAQIEKIVTYAKNQLPEGADSDIIFSFIKLFYSQAWVEDIKSRSVRDLFGAAASQWQLLKKMKPGEVQFKIFNPTLKKDGWENSHTIIQIVVDDMPFVIDSMRMELDRLGVTTHLMVHMGGMNVVRDSKNKIIKLGAYDLDCQKGCNKSPIYLEIDHVSSKNALQDIQNNLLRVLRDVYHAVADWQPMCAKVRDILDDLGDINSKNKNNETSESIAFLEWMLADHFTFLGTRDYKVVHKKSKPALKLINGSGMGVLRDDSQSRAYRYIDEMPEKVQEMILSKENMIFLSKTNTRSTVHRPTYTDYLVIKQFNKGDLIGVKAFIGLFTSSAYNAPPKTIPFIRQKVAAILHKSGLPPRSHAGKDLLHILTTLPRDDLFQAPQQDLYDLALDILHIQERRQVRLFLREDTYQRFISCFVYVPRDNFNTEIIRRIEKVFRQTFKSREISFDTHFSESILARIHYTVRVDPKQDTDYDVNILEQQIVLAASSWRDDLREAIVDHFHEERGAKIFRQYQHAFPVSYRENFTPSSAVADIDHMESLTADKPLAISFYRPAGADDNVICFKLFNSADTFPLSDALPMLENMGMRVIGEEPYQILHEDQSCIWINDFYMTYLRDSNFDVEEVKSIFQDAFLHVWSGHAENDSLNRLVLEAQLSWREISILRAYTKYLQQTGFTFSTQYIIETLVTNANIAKLLVDLFETYYCPTQHEKSIQKAEELESIIHTSLDDVLVLNQDRILRRILDLIHATLRTNYYQTDEKGAPKDYLSFKLDPRKVPELPRPLPMYEIFVYSPRFEGVHLRAGKVARGGLRWSDRREDFRTEVLGLMKAQRVKNAVIVPSGAKGGFVPKRLPENGTRDEIIQEGIACYKNFISGLLDLTDNLNVDKTIPPANTVCYDSPDPYLVVAADKGTATFSDIANAIAIERGFWMGDAFASGGSTGYDHKKMGITARGAWVSAERHCQDLGFSLNDTEVTIAGIGDMSGDVFGNGMLMSNKIKLVAAFDHRHIFIDPNPDCEASYLERVRLFNLPRSSWNDYNRKLISKGGGIFSRALKSIPLSKEMQAILDVNKEQMVPLELIKAILRAPVDLLWNGGVGTYIKSTLETNIEVGDRNNDAVRINGNELRAKVVAEGGNLGLTQLGRIEFSANNGLINTDFIDNSAGVDCSDHEVNIKILLNKVMFEKKLTEKQRNQLLAKMTDEVTTLVLCNNYRQSQALSATEHHAKKYMGLYWRYLQRQESLGKIDRGIEFLPDDKTLQARKAEGLSFTRPELAVLLAYSKIILEDQIRQSELTQDPYLRRFIVKAFPAVLSKNYAQQLVDHRLAREIISTQLSNQLVSDMGLTFVYQMNDETGAPVSAIVRAYAAAHEIFNMSKLKTAINELDHKVDAMIQYEMLDEVMRLVRRGSRWILRNRREHHNISDTIDTFASKVKSLSKRLPKLLLGKDKQRFETRQSELLAANVPEELCTLVAGAPPLYHAFNIIEAAGTHDIQINQVAKIYFTLVDRLDLFFFRSEINSYPLDSHWTVLANSSYKADLDWIQRELTKGVLCLDVGAKTIGARINAWFETHSGLIKRWEEILGHLRGLETKEFAILSVAIRELIDLAQTSAQTH